MTVLPPETHDRLVREKHGEAIAFRIRAELVCCDIYARISDTNELEIGEARNGRDWHDLCYWGEASARIAEGRCPGYETQPNLCRCQCEGCKHNCNAHLADTTPTDSAEPDLVEPDNPAAWALARHIAAHPLSTFQKAMRYLNSQVVVEVHEVDDSDWRHTYLSTSCLHARQEGRTELHNYCQNKSGAAGPKKPAVCKFCDAPCICPCH